MSLNQIRRCHFSRVQARSAPHIFEQPFAVSCCVQFWRFGTTAVFAPRSYYRYSHPPFLFFFGSIQVLMSRNSQLTNTHECVIKYNLLVLSGCYKHLHQKTSIKIPSTNSPNTSLAHYEIPI